MYITASEVMQRYSISRTTLFRWERDGKLPEAKYFNSLKRWSLNDLESWETQ